MAKASVTVSSEVSSYLSVKLLLQYKHNLGSNQLSFLRVVSKNGDANCSTGVTFPLCAAMA